MYLSDNSLHGDMANINQQTAFGRPPGGRRPCSRGQICLIPKIYARVRNPSSAASDSMARVAYSSHVLAELAARSVENFPSATRVARSSMSESAKSGGLMDARP